MAFSGSLSLSVPFAWFGSDRECTHFFRGTENDDDGDDDDDDDDDQHACCYSKVCSFFGALVQLRFKMQFWYS